MPSYARKYKRRGKPSYARRKVKRANARNSRKVMVNRMPRLSKSIIAPRYFTTIEATFQGRLGVTATESQYFDVYMNGLEPERYYQLLIKVIINGETIVFDNNNIFKVVR